MTRNDRRSNHSIAAVVALLSVGATMVLVGLWMGYSPRTVSADDGPVVLSSAPPATRSVAQTSAGASADASDTGDARSTSTATPVASVADPTSLRLPSIGLARSGIMPLEVLDDGTLEVPDDPQQLGWWRAGAEPGEAGPAVIVGHIDSQDGPGVFFHLREVQAGDRIEVGRADGTQVTFEVTHVEQHAKDDFPTQAVYGDADKPVLRLVTCGGEFDDGSGHYLDNIVVFARMA